MKKQTRILWKFQCKNPDYGFIIPDDKDIWGSDFFVYSKNFAWALDGQRVAAELCERVSGRRPEAKIIEVFSGQKNDDKKQETIKIIEGVFSWGRGDFWFVDVAWEEQGYFCYGLKKKWSQRWWQSSRWNQKIQRKRWSGSAWNTQRGRPWKSILNIFMTWKILICNTRWWKWGYIYRWISQSRGSLMR